MQKVFLFIMLLCSVLAHADCGSTECVQAIRVGVVAQDSVAKHSVMPMKVMPAKKSE